MYNGIGLQTPRGSGTSGYIQRNLSHFKNKLNNKDDFLKKLKQIHENPIQAQRKANPEIVEHEQKREIQLHLLELRERLEELGTAEDQILEKIAKAEEKLKIKMDKGEIDLTRNAHSLTVAKQKDYEKMKSAFNMKEDHSLGKAFDFDGQKKQKMEKEYQREVEKSEKIAKYIEQKIEEKREIKRKEKQSRKDEKKKMKDEKKAKKESKKRSSSTSEEESNSPSPPRTRNTQRSRSRSLNEKKRRN